MNCKRCGKEYATEIGACPYCGPLNKKAAGKLGQDFVSRLFAGDIPQGTPFGTRYLMDDLLGRGGMGIVYKAKDKVLDVEVAIKLLNPLFSSDKDIIERFKQEIKLTRRINHQNVIRIFDLGVVDGIRYISMEYVQGKDLKEVIRAEGGGLPLNFAIKIIRQIAQGLQVAHDLGIIHRDIKPQNILVKKNGDLKLLDFGIARLAGSEDMTRTGSLLGSPVYMSPEQASGKEADHRSDIYSVGVILFEIFTGRIPFLADTPIATALKHVNEQPPRPTSLNPEIPIWVENVILKAMEKDLEKRYQSVVEIIDPVYGLHVDRISDTDFVICPECGKRNPEGSSTCSNCQAYVGRETKSSQPADGLDDKELKKEVKRLLESANRAYEEDKLQVAKDRIERILIVNDRNSDAKKLLAKIDKKIALEKKINLYHQNALISYQDKKYEDAINLWERIIQLDPSHIETRSFLEKARSEQGIYNKIKGHISKGLQSYNLNDYEDAIAQWEKVIEIDPRNVEAAFYISKAQTLLNFEQKTRNLKKQAELYFSQKVFDKALECYEELSRLDRDNLSISLRIDEIKDASNIYTHHEKGLAFYKKHEYQDAINTWNAILQIDPDNLDAKNYIIQARAKINEGAKVKEIFRIGLTHIRDKKWKQAISRFEDVKKFEGPYQSEALRYINMARTELTKQAKITKLLQEGHEIYRQDYHDQASKIWGVSAAIKQWEKILEIAPKHSEAKENIAKAKLIIKRARIIEDSQKDVLGNVGEIQQEGTPTKTITPKIMKKKVKIERKACKAVGELREYVVGAVVGGAVGDALGVGTSWVSMSDDALSVVGSYQKNTVGRFKGVTPGEGSGEFAVNITSAREYLNDAQFQPKNLLKAMLKESNNLRSPLEKSSELLILKLKKGIPWKQAVLTEENDFSPLYRSLLAALTMFTEGEKMFNRVKAVTMLTHKNSEVLACSIASAYALTSILEYKNDCLLHERPMIGSDSSTDVTWDDNQFLKNLCSIVEYFDADVAEKIMELLIYMSLPSDRFFDTVGMSDTAIETLLCSLYCFLKHKSNFVDAVTLAINARGIARNITGNRHGIAGLTGFYCGAFNGFVHIPPRWLNGLLENESTFSVADDFFQNFYIACS